MVKDKGGQGNKNKSSKASGGKKTKKTKAEKQAEFDSFFEGDGEDDAGAESFDDGGGSGDELASDPIAVLEEFNGNLDDFKRALFGTRQLNKAVQSERANTANRKGQTLLHLAVDWSYEPVIPLLLESGADPNARDKQGKTPAHIALELGSEEALGALLSAKGLETDCYDKSGSTLLVTALKGANWAAAQKLLDLGADVGRADRRKNTPLHALCLGARDVDGALPPSVEALAAALLQKGTKIDAQDFDGNTALILAAGTRAAPARMSMSAFLLDAGADVAVLSRAGKSAVDAATRAGDSDLAQKLTDRGAPSDPSGPGLTAEEEEKKEAEEAAAEEAAAEAEAAAVMERQAKAEAALLKANEGKKRRKLVDKGKIEEPVKEVNKTIGCMLMMGAFMFVFMAYLMVTEPPADMQQPGPPPPQRPPPPPMQLGSPCNGFDRICPKGTVCLLDEELDYSICMEEQ